MTLPECDKNCVNHFHMTGGRHLTICALHKYDEVASLLDLAKLYNTTGQRDAISCPAVGTLMTDSDTEIDYCYNGENWVPVIASKPSQHSQ